MQYNNLLFYLLFIILYNILYNIYNLLFIRLAVITHNCLVGKGRLKERCGLESRTNYFFRLRNRQKLVRFRFWCGFDSRIYGNTGRFIMYSGITKIYYRKTVRHVFTKPVQIEGTTQEIFPRKLFFIVVHISADRRCECML